MYFIVGLGNPGVEYEDTRHNIGREILELFVNRIAKEGNGSDWKFEKKLNATTASLEVGKNKVKAILPETFMNLSGKCLVGLITSPKKAEKLIVVHDDLDLPIGEIKISFNRGSGGHKGVESIIKNVKTKAFTRVRIGVGTTTASGKIKKPVGEDAVQKFVLGKFKDAEQEKIKKAKKRSSEALMMILEKGIVRAMNEFN